MIPPAPTFSMYEKTESTTPVGECAMELPRKKAGSETQQVTMTTTQHSQASHAPPEGCEKRLTRAHPPSRSPPALPRWQ